MLARLPKLAEFPEISLETTHLLPATGLTPFGKVLEQQDIETLWHKHSGQAGETVPGWFVLSSSDTPSGTQWEVVFCPPVGALPSSSVYTLPVGLWVLQQCEAKAVVGSEQTLVVPSPYGTWVAVFRAQGCTTLVGPLPDHDARLAQLPPDSTVISYAKPDSQKLLALQKAHPEAELLPFAEAQNRQDRWHLRVQARTLAFFMGLVVLITLGLQLAVWQQAWRNHRWEQKLSQWQPLLEQQATLQTRQSQLKHEIAGLRTSLFPNSRSAALLAHLSNALPPDAYCTAIALQSDATLPHPWSVHFQIRLAQWADIAPLQQRLQAVAGVRKVVMEQQTSTQNEVEVLVGLQGVWP